MEESVNAAAAARTVEGEFDLRGARTGVVGLYTVSRKTGGSPGGNVSAMGKGRGFARDGCSPALAKATFRPYGQPYADLACL